MNTTTASPTRLFGPFIDATDMVMGVAADEPLREINHRMAPHRLHFPLVCDPARTLREHLAAIDYAPHSARFGAYVDNVLGMNWRLPSGAVVRIGERVIKSTTGFDLLRFLLHSDGRYGRAEDYVIRLRPLGQETARVHIHGLPDALRQFRRRLLRSPWIHWLDAVDLHLSRSGGPFLQIEASGAAGEAAIFNGFLADLAKQFQLSARPASPTPIDHLLPQLTLKATVTSVEDLVRSLIEQYGGTARVLCVNATAHYFPPPELPAAELDLRDLRERCEADGGHLFGLRAPAPAPRVEEAAWAHVLETAWKSL